MNKREEIERKVVTHLIRTAKVAGYELVSVDDGGDMLTKCTTEEQGLALVFAVESSVMRFCKPGQGSAHLATIVLGNDGWDCIADCSQGEGWDAVMEAVQGYADKFCEGAS